MQHKSWEDGGSNLGPAVARGHGGGQQAGEHGLGKSAEAGAEEEGAAKQQQETGHAQRQDGRPGQSQSVRAPARRP
jgi:hypothetical protein